MGVHIHIHPDSSGGGSGGGGGEAAALATKITRTELLALRDGGNLVPGTWYRITDYACSTTQANTQSAGHAFDIIILAVDESHLNENAFAALHEGDTYFAGSNLEAWELKYCLDNDTNRFAWADDTNGKGVVYFMKDEFGNECPYDFKNIQFTRKLTNGALDTSTGTDTWVYTFNVWDGDLDACCDGTVYAAEGFFCRGNTMGESSVDGVDSLPDNVFLNEYGEGYYWVYCQYNTFGNNCVGNTFGNYCRSNTVVAYTEKATVFDGVMYCAVQGHNDTSSGNKLQNIQILNGTAGTNDSNKLAVAFTNGVSYTQVAGKNSSGVLKIWIPADAAS